MKTMTRCFFLLLALLGTHAGARAAGLEVAELAEQFAIQAEGAYLISESDYEPQFVTAALSGPDEVLTPSLVMDAFADDLQQFFAGEGSDVLQRGAAVELASEAETSALLTDLATPYEGADEYVTASARAFARIQELFEAKLTGVRAAKIGPAAADGSLATDAGLYALLVIGRTRDGQLAGFLVGTVET